MFSWIRLRANTSTGYGYGYGGFPFPSLKLAGTGISPLTLSTSVSGTAPFVPSGTAPCTASGGPYKASNSSGWAYPTDHPTHGPFPFWKRAAFYPAGTIGTAASTIAWGSTATGTVGTAGSTGLASAPSSFGTSGKPTYTAPTGIPAEYFYHHKRPKRNVSRSLFFATPKGMRNILTELTQAARGGRYGYQA